MSASKLQAAFRIQIQKLERAGASMGKADIHLAKNKESGFDAKTSVTMTTLCGQLGLEIIDVKTDLLKFLEDEITEDQKLSCLGTPNDGNYAKEWLRTFEPLLVQFNTLIKELKGTWLPIHCSIAELQYPKRGLTLMSAHIGLVTFQLLVGLVTLLIVHFNYLCLKL